MRPFPVALPLVGLLAVLGGGFLLRRATRGASSPTSSLEPGASPAREDAAPSLAATKNALVPPLSPAEPDGPPLVFRDVFASPAASTRSHLRARYTDAKGQAHELEVFREGDRRLKRATDSATLIFATFDATAADYEYSLVDRRRGVLTRVSRANAYRIGSFTDFSSLASLISRPTASFTLRAARDRGAIMTAAGPCAQYVITPATEVCWSTRWGVALQVRSVGLALDVVSIDDQVADSDFAIDTTGLRIVDANQDIAPTAD